MKEGKGREGKGRIVERERGEKVRERSIMFDIVCMIFSSPLTSAWPVPSAGTR